MRMLSDEQLVILDPLYDSQTGDILADMEVLTYQEAEQAGIVRKTDTEARVFTVYDWPNE